MARLHANCSPMLILRHHSGWPDFLCACRLRRWSSGIAEWYAPTAALPAFERLYVQDLWMPIPGGFQVLVPRSYVKVRPMDSERYRQVFHLRDMAYLQQEQSWI